MAQRQAPNRALISVSVVLPTWFLAMHLMTQAKNNVSPLDLKRYLDVPYPTAWLLQHEIMQVMFLREESRQLTGRVEIDDSYLGGEVQGGKASRGAPNKVPFVAAVQTTESGHPIRMCLSQRAFARESIQALAWKSLVAPATLVSDGLGCFTAVRGMGILHEPHATEQEARRYPRFNVRCNESAASHLGGQIDRPADIGCIGARSRRRALNGSSSSD